MSFQAIPQPPEVSYPLLGERVQATFIDAIIILAALFAISAGLDSFQKVPDWLPATLFAVFCLLYIPLCTTVLGGTVGQKMKGLTVRSVQQPQQKLRLAPSSLRFLVKAGLGWISYFSLPGNVKKRALHDLASGSIVLYQKDLKEIAVV